MVVESSTRDYFWFKLTLILHFYLQYNLTESLNMLIAYGTQINCKRIEMRPQKEYFKKHLASPFSDMLLTCLINQQFLDPRNFCRNNMNESTQFKWIIQFILKLRSKHQISILYQYSLHHILILSKGTDIIINPIYQKGFKKKKKKKKIWLFF